MEQHDRRITNLPPKTTGLVEIIKRTSTGYDSREGSTFYEYEKIGVYSSELAALRAILKMNPELTIQPLVVND